MTVSTLVQFILIYSSLIWKQAILLMYIIFECVTGNQPELSNDGKISCS